MVKNKGILNVRNLFLVVISIFIGSITILTAILFYNYRDRLVSPANPQSNPNAQTPVALSLTPASQTLSSNTSGRLGVSMVTNGNGVSSAGLVITYNPSVIRVDNIVPGTFFTDPGIGAPVEVRKTIDNTAGRVQYALGFPLGSHYASTENKPLAVITFSTLNSGTTQLSFITSGVINTHLTNQFAQLVPISVTGASVAVGGSVVTAPPAGGQIFPNADANVNSNNPTMNFGSDGRLYVNGTPKQITYFKFDLTRVTAPVRSAVLQLYTGNSSQGSFQAKLVTEVWTESKINFDNKPQLRGLITTFTPAPASQWTSVNMTSFVNNNRGSVASFAIETDSSDNAVFYSRNSLSNKPYISIQ